MHPAYHFHAADAHQQAYLRALQRDLHLVFGAERVRAQKNAVLLDAYLEAQGQVFGLAHPLGLKVDPQVLTVRKVGDRSRYRP